MAPDPSSDSPSDSPSDTSSEDAAADSPADAASDSPTDASDPSSNTTTDSDSATDSDSPVDPDSATDSDSPVDPDSATDSDSSADSSSPTDSDSPVDSPFDAVSDTTREPVPDTFPSASSSSSESSPSSGSSASTGASESTASDSSEAAASESTSSSESSPSGSESAPSLDAFAETISDPSGAADDARADDDTDSDGDADSGSDADTSSEADSVDDPLFDSNHRIFANKDLLKIGHVPDADRIVGRDEEITKLAKRLNGAVHGYSPENVIIYGKTGTGKSLVSRHVSQRAGDAAKEGVDIGTAYIDCAEDNTETQAVSSLAAKLNDESETDISVPHTGLSTAKYYKLLWRILDARFDSVIIILDEIDLMSGDSILMKLSRAEEAGKIDCSIGVIAISNKIQYVDDLNERVKSSFQHKELFFKPYDANQLRDIMHNRADAFREGVLTEDAIPLAAAFAAQEHGDARKAIDILRHAGEVAYEAGDERVREEHVRRAQRHAEKDRFRELVHGAPMQAKAALLALTELTVNSEDDAFLTSRVYDQYEAICRYIDIDALSMRRFRDILKEQAFLGVVEIEKINKGSAGGIHLQNRLIEDPIVVRETILEDDRMQVWAEE